MQLTINVDESMFKDILEKELLAFSKEELHEIIKGAVKEYLEKPEVMDRLFFASQDRYGYRCSEPSDAFKRIVNSIDFTEPLKDITDTMVKDLEEHHRDILEELLYKSMAHQMMDTYMKEGWLTDAFMTIRSQLSSH